MNNRIVYFSRGGNTAKLARAIGKGTGLDPDPLPPMGLEGNVDVLFLGASIYAGKVAPEVRAFLDALQPGQVKQVVVFGTSMGPKTARQEVRDALHEKGIAVSEREFHCPGSFLFFNKGRPGPADFLHAEEFAAAVCRSCMRAMVAQ